MVLKSDNFDYSCGVEDIKELLSQGEIEFISTGIATGNNRVVAAFAEVINDPLVGTSLERISSSLYIVEGGLDLSMYETSDAAALLESIIPKDSKVTFGTDISSDLEGHIRLFLIAVR